LNAGVGHLHGRERERSDLAFDLMEEWRSVIVDSLVMELVNKRIIKPTDFTWADEEGGIYLTKGARRIFLKRFEDRMCMQMSHPDVKVQVSYRRAIHLQVKRYVRAVLGQGVYEPYRRLK
jgi:CRISP-associated protein Cas1